VTTDSWNVDASGKWLTAADWSEGHVPLAGEDVVISTQDGALISLRDGSVSINSLIVNGESEFSYNAPYDDLTIANLAIFDNTADISGGTLDLLGSTSYAYGIFDVNGTLNIKSGIFYVSGIIDYFQGNVTGSGVLDIDGGTANIEFVNLEIADIVVMGFITIVVSLFGGGSYSGDFTLSGGATFDLFEDAGTTPIYRLLGTVSLDEGKLIGVGQFVTAGTVQVSGLTVGGTLNWVNSGQATQSADDLVIGDSSADDATLTIAAGGVYAISDDTGVDRGHAAGSMIYNLGTFGKTGGTATSVVAVSIHDTGTIENAIAGSHLEFDGARNVFSGTFTGPGMIDFGPDSVSTLAALQYTESALRRKCGDRQRQRPRDARRRLEGRERSRRLLGPYRRRRIGPGVGRDGPPFHQ
jgi:hypothetical protein